MNLATPRSLQPAAVQGLPADFRWGVATSSYQIEGAPREDGRTPSIWDTFCEVPGAVHNAENGDVACDHYHRMPQDVELIAGLGVDTYRFSLAWPRIQPGGRGPVNAKGMDFYKRLVDELQDRNVTPWITLYHWDLPQELEDAGGWPARDTAFRFADYAMLAYEALGDRVEHWTTLNEPWCSAMLGYAYGAHAPGRSDMGDAMGAVHHLLLGHGLAAQRMRAAAGDNPLELGITLNLGTATPETDSEADREACRRADGMGTRLYLDPIVRGSYPQDVVEDLAAQGIELPVQDGDLATIATPSTSSASTSTEAPCSPESPRRDRPPTPTASPSPVVWSATCPAPRWTGRSPRPNSPICCCGSSATTRCPPSSRRTGRPSTTPSPPTAPSPTRTAPPISPTTSQPCPKPVPRARTCGATSPGR